MPSSIISTTSTSTTQSKNPFASKNETKFLNHQQNNTLLHAGNKLHVATYSRDTHSNSFKTHESQIAMMRDDVINQYTRNRFDIVEHSNHEIKDQRLNQIRLILIQSG